MNYLAKKALAKLAGVVWHRFRFAEFGAGSFMVNPISVFGQKYIKVGKNVRIRDHLRLEAIDEMRIPEISIGDHTNIEQNVHIICSSKISIGRECSITANCCIVDTSHPFRNPGDKKIGERLNSEFAEVVIGDGSFIGVSSVILPNARLGKRCVVGAHSVVTAGDYPDNSVLVGSPARVMPETNS